jgi:hypothetical protein
MQELLIFHLSTIGLLMFKKGEVEEAKESREKAVVEAEDEIQIRNRYQLRVLNHFEGMKLRSNDRWLSIVRNLSAIEHSEANSLPHPHLQTGQLQLHNQQSLSNHLQPPRPLSPQQNSHSKNKPAT